MKTWPLIPWGIVLFLTSAGISGCSFDNHSNRIVPETAVYEQYKAGSSQMQSRFDLLTEGFFLSEVKNSTIDLHYSFQDPEAAGITEYPITFGNYSLEQMKQDMEKLKKLQTQLAEIDVTRLSEESQLTYDILEEFLASHLKAEGLELYGTPLSPVVGLQSQLPVLLAEYAFYDLGDVTDYLLLLAQIDEYYSQILEVEKLRSTAGLFMSDRSADQIIASCEGYLTPPETSFLHTTFVERIQGLPGLSQAEKADLTSQNLQILKENFIPAYELLSTGLASLKGTGTNDQGLSHYPQGKQYYEYLIAASIGTSYPSVPQLALAVEAAMMSDLTAMAALVKEHPSLLDQLSNDSFSMTDPTEILESLKKQTEQDFPPLPDCEYTIKYVPEALEDSLSPAFYLTPPMDDYRQNTIYINGSDRYNNAELFPTLAHEGYPGHLYQTVYFTAGCEDRLRQLLPFSSYSEGWASYVEIYSYGLDNGLEPAMGQLLAHNHAAVVALHALMDIKVNYEGWSLEQMSSYLKESYGLTDEKAAGNLYDTVIQTPTNYLEYYVGYLEIEEMRKLAKEQLGDRFRLKDFHAFLLDIGPAPFSVIRPYFEQWVAGQIIS